MFLFLLVVGISSYSRVGGYLRAHAQLRWHYIHLQVPEPISPRLSIYTGTPLEI